MTDINFLHILFASFTLALFIYLSMQINKLRYLKSVADRILNSVSRDITDSINYAKAIQEATFPDEAKLKEYFEDVFVIFKPMEAVSGDFHWFGTVNGRLYLAVVDCQGHGVPGAFLSMIGNTLLNQVVVEEKTAMPQDILKKMNMKLQSILSSTVNTEIQNDVMNIGLCLVDYDEGRIYYSGANHSLYYVQDGKFRELEGDRFSLGFAESEVIQGFMQFDIKIEGSLMLYLTSEGFGYSATEPDDRIASLQMINLILKIGSIPFHEQYAMILEELNRFEYHKLQTDDFTIIGLQVR